MSIREQIRGLNLPSNVKIVGILGHNIQYSLSPKMHGYAFQKLGLDFKYVLFDVAPKDLGAAVADLKSAGVAGLNVTIPHKEAMLPFLDDAGADARQVGAINTIVNQNGRWIGENTDMPGFLENLRRDEGFEPKGKKVVALGSGGTAKALSYALLKAGARELTILNRTREKAEKTIVQFLGWFSGPKLNAAELSAESLKKELAGCELFINTSPRGLDDFPQAQDEFNRSWPRTALFFDAVYAQKTGLFRAAKESGARCVNGLGLLIRQGALSFSLWTGKTPPVDLMKEALADANAR